MRRSFSAEDTGSVSVLVAIAMAAVFGAAAFAVDLPYFYQNRDRLQIIADAAAHAGAMALGEGKTELQIRQYAADIANLNVPPSWSGISYSPTNVKLGIYKDKVFVEGAQGANAVKVEVSRNDIPGFFARLLGVGLLSAEARAIALNLPISSDCILATDSLDKPSYTPVAYGSYKSDPKKLEEFPNGVFLEGEAIIDAPACGVYANHPGKTAHNQAGDTSMFLTGTLTRMVAQSICAHGRLPPGSRFYAPKAPEISKVKQGAQDCPVREAPFMNPNKGRYIAEPFQESSLVNYNIALPLDPKKKLEWPKFENGEYRFCPGTFSNSSITAGSTVVLRFLPSTHPLCQGVATQQPNLYNLLNSAIYIAGGASVKAEGVAFYLDKDSAIEMAGHGDTVLSPPASGPWKGIVVAQSPKAREKSRVNVLRGGAALDIKGIWWTPESYLVIAGNPGAVAKTVSSAVIVRRLKLSGEATLKFAPETESAAPTNRAVLVN